MEEAWGEDVVSKQSFRAQLFKIIRHAAEDEDLCTNTLLGTLVDLWLTDIMDGNSLDQMEWWAELESWGTRRDARRQIASDFVRDLLRIFELKLEEHDTNSFLSRMLAQFEEDSDLRFRAIEGYYRFIQDVQHTIWAQLPVTCVIGGHASGDMFGIGASALLKQNMNVVVHFKDDKPEQDHSAGMYSFFSELLGRERVRLAETARGCFDRTAFSNSVYELMRSQRLFCWLAPYNMGTYFLSDRFQKEGGTNSSELDNRDTIRRGFAVEKLRKQGAILDFLHRRVGSLDSLKKRRVLILWSRFTGKKGEYHPEHDTSFKGMAQMAWLAAELGFCVIIAGDKPILHEGVKDTFSRKYQYGDICRSLESYYGEPRCFDLTEFWTEPAWKELSGGKRVAQYQLYELLHRVCDVRHLGMRSGNMEALALLGYFVRYMEEDRSYGGERMVAWHETGIGYERILLIEPPTRVGKYIHYDRKLKVGVSQASMPPYITARNNGFPNTASRNKPRFSEQLQQFQARQTETFNSMHAMDSRRATFQLDTQQELTRLTQELKEKMTKPSDVSKYESGFTPEDLLQICEFLCLTNPRAENPLEEPPTPNPVEGRLGKLNLRQYKILSAIRTLLERK
ncbi:hypothetical protein D7Y21_09750 [Corallococcus sp. AB045]|uniref:hypothetical protein n=1 Tax=Corallococcus sp. AB045 TaxID=2316719 RepID=UPI000ECA741F|nr:hypothetical protein [Corallococcus sp. AB045]RKH89647.1 hypothetical protein D7Y21_09750 [Corallococcus sp. AB045]